MTIVGYKLGSDISNVIESMITSTMYTFDLHILRFSSLVRGGRVVRRCWVKFQCLGVLLIWIIVGQGPIALVVGAGGVFLDIFTLHYLISSLTPSLWETARYRLKYCLKGPLNPKQPTNLWNNGKILWRCTDTP